MNSRNFFIPFLGYLILVSCQSQNPGSAPFHQPVSYSPEEFAAYWYAGTAEVSTYTLLQSRYGEIREGNTTLIFVTEPFSRGKQVKVDQIQENDPDQITVLKLNHTKKFLTGIYPYSMMLSVFTPVDTYHHPYTLKTTLSSQEWCGQSFTQINQVANQYRVKGFSYFESEGDVDVTLNYAVLEDELWNRIRINPEALPIGEFSIIHSSFHQRLAHEELEVSNAVGELKDHTDPHIQTYVIQYIDGRRSVEIHFETSFPFRIMGWKETNVTDGTESITTAQIKKTINTPYWRQNSSEYEYLRDTLKLK